MKTVKWVLCLHLSQWLTTILISKKLWHSHFCPHIRTLNNLVPLYLVIHLTWILPSDKCILLFLHTFNMCCKLGASGECVTPSAGSAVELHVSLITLRTFLSSAVLSALHQRSGWVSICRLPHFVGTECFASVPDPPRAAEWNVLPAHQTD